MAAKQRHRARSVRGHGDERRPAPLVPKNSRDCADENAGRAQPDDRRAGAEERREVIGQVREIPIGNHSLARGPMDR